MTSRDAQNYHLPDGWQAVETKTLQALSDSLNGNCYRGQDWEREAIDTLLSTAPAEQAARTLPAPDNVRAGEPYDNPAFEDLARTMGVWGTAQAALCAQFFLAGRDAKAAPLTDERIRQLDDATKFHESHNWSVRFARAIEAAHGIKEATDGQQTWPRAPRQARTHPRL